MSCLKDKYINKIANIGISRATAENLVEAVEDQKSIESLFDGIGYLEEQAIEILTDFHHEFAVAKFETLQKEKLYVDMDGVLADFDRAMKNKNDYQKKEAKRKKGFFLNLKPIDGALEAFEELSNHYNVFILSTPSWSSEHSWSEKKQWVEKHLGKYGYKKLILTHDKSIFSGAALIDDRTVNGASDFQGEFIQFGSKKFPDWKSVLKHLIKN